MTRSLVLTLALAGCSSEPEKARRILSTIGYTDIQVAGHAFFNECEKGESATRFYAVNPYGYFEVGEVCCRPIRGCAIRY